MLFEWLLCVRRHGRGVRFLVVIRSQEANRNHISRDFVISPRREYSASPLNRKDLEDAAWVVARHLGELKNMRLLVEIYPVLVCYGCVTKYCKWST